MSSSEVNPFKKQPKVLVPDTSDETLDYFKLI